MKTLSCYVGLASVAFAMSCGGDSGGGPGSGAASVTGISGDNQVGPTGGQLEFPLGMIVLGSNGQPVSGVVVSWSVPIGQATLAQTLDTSDVNGAAGTAVTLGAQTGQTVVRATIPGIAAPVDFHVTVVNSCTFTPVLPVPATVNGHLTTLDCPLIGGWLYDLYDLTSNTQRGVTTTMSSTTFNTYLEIFTIRNGFYEFSAVNDDADSNTTNAAIQMILGPGAPAIVGANTNLAGATGPYTLLTATRPQTLGGCVDEVWITRGVTIPENIATTDCPDSTPGGVFYSDVAGIIAYDGTVLTIAQRSTVIDPFLSLFQIDTLGLLIEVASNDDSSAGNLNAFIQYTVTTPAVYVIVASTSPVAQTGAYTLVVSSSVTASAPVFSAPPRRTASPRFLRQHKWRPLRIQPRTSANR